MTQRQWRSMSSPLPFAAPPDYAAATMSTASTLTVCADDYGLAPGVSLAIRDLILKRRLHATGCMTGSAHWPDEAQLLKPLDGLADIGLHITLTEQKPLTTLPKLAPDGKLPGVEPLIKRAWTGRLDRREIEQELNAQYDAFVTAFGRAPDFLDGHHHSHQLPVIRDVVLDLWRNRMGGQGWVRSCWESPLALYRRGVDQVRASIIALLGREWHRMMIRHGVPHNQSFRGVYDLTDRVPFETLFAAFTHAPAPRTLVMVHPGHVDEALRAADCLTDQRETEFAFLAGETCGRMLAQRGLSLAKLF